MHKIAQPTEGKTHVKTSLKDDVVFNASAVRIAILDRWGKVIWKKERGQSLEPIAWNGIDLFGSKVSSGSYTCKIVYPDSLVVYVPFVFFQK